MIIPYFIAHINHDLQKSRNPPHSFLKYTTPDWTWEYRTHSRDWSADNVYSKLSCTNGITLFPPWARGQFAAVFEAKSSSNYDGSLWNYLSVGSLALIDINHITRSSGVIPESCECPLAKNTAASIILSQKAG